MVMRVSFEESRRIAGSPFPPVLHTLKPDSPSAGRAGIQRRTATRAMVRSAERSMGLMPEPGATLWPPALDLVDGLTSARSTRSKS